MGDANGAAILVADDQADVRETLRLTLKTAGYSVATAESPAAVLAFLERQRCAVAIMDLNYSSDTTSGQEGLELLKQVRQREPDLPVVVITAWSNTDLVVQVMQNGAADFLEKPWDNQRLLNIVSHLFALSRSRRSAETLAAENRLLRDSSSDGPLLAESQAMRDLLLLIEDIADADANVLITGENGTGKTELARHVHERSQRRDKRFVQVNIGALTESLFESELFGHVKGAFTDARENRVGRFELAHEGTLFLDEIANVTSAQQNRLLHVLESGEYQPVGSSRTRIADARIISATNADLEQLMARGEFRQDLYFRLNTVLLHLPPLRERRDDILPLATLFLNRYSAKYRRDISAFEAPAQALLQDYGWPGNVRELMHVVERACLVTRGDEIRAESLAIEGRRIAAPTSTELVTIEGAEQALIEQTLEHFQHNVSRAADSLGISRGALYRRMDHYGIVRRGD